MLTTQITAIAIIVMIYQIAVIGFGYYMQDWLKENKKADDVEKDAHHKRAELENQIAYIQDITRNAEMIMYALALSEEHDVAGGKRYVCTHCKTQNNNEHDDDCIIGCLLTLYRNTNDEITAHHFPVED